MKRGDISFWLTRPDAPAPPPTRTLHSDIDCDVAIVGGGLSGLWVAWALAQQRPELSIAVLEAERLGFGASGRNGGWMSAKQVGVRRALARGAGGAKAVTEMQDRLEQACVEVVDILGAQEIDARRGGWTQLARSVSELRRAENYVAESRRWNLDESSIRMMSAEETYERIHARGIMGAVHSPHNYCVDPVKMVFRLASLAMNAGAAVYTGARVTGITPGRLEVRSVRGQGLADRGRHRGVHRKPARSAAAHASTQQQHAGHRTLDFPAVGHGGLGTPRRRIRHRPHLLPQRAHP